MGELTTEHSLETTDYRLPTTSYRLYVSESTVGQEHEDKMGRVACAILGKRAIDSFFVPDVHVFSG